MGAGQTVAVIGLSVTHAPPVQVVGIIRGITPLLLLRFQGSNACYQECRRYDDSNIHIIYNARDSDLLSFQGVKGVKEVKGVKDDSPSSCDKYLQPIQ